MRRVILVLSLLLVPAAALAQAGHVELSPRVGYRLSGAFDPNLNIKVDESVDYGVALDLPLSQNWQFEILANRQQTSFSVDRGLLSTENKLGDVDLTVIHGGFLLEWGVGQVSPFLVASAGVTHIEPQFNELDSDTRFSASLGGGVKVFFTQNVGLRFEARGYWTDLDTGFNGRYDRYDHGDGLYQGEASAGLIFAF
jgi:opacity protein-like surface antigen